eukprot:1816647-Amphidinium_carterae.1
MVFSSASTNSYERPPLRIRHCQLTLYSWGDGYTGHFPLGNISLVRCVAHQPQPFGGHSSSNILCGVTLWAASSRPKTWAASKPHTKSVRGERGPPQGHHSGVCKQNDSAADQFVFWSRFDWAIAKHRWNDGIAEFVGERFRRTPA